MPDPPRLLLEWSSPWREFFTALRPALGPSAARLAGEARSGLFPIRGMLLSWILEAIFLAGLIWIPSRLFTVETYTPTTPPKFDVIYFSGDELPQTPDRGGAQAGKTGRAGGQQAFHRTQAIRVARGSSVVNKVVDAPDVKLPVSTDPVANLLVYKPVPGPPPAEGLESSVTPPTFSKDAIVAPPPEVLRSLNRRTPGLSATVVAPPPSDLSRTKSHAMMGLSTAVISPAPQEVPRDQSRSVIAMTSPIIQPAPDVKRDPPPIRGPAAATTAVVPPPVSAPPRDTSQTARLTLPAPAVVAPPPSQVTRDRSTSGVALIDSKVVPPPAQIGGRSQDRHPVPGLVGTNQVVPPPPTINPGTALSGGGSGHNERPGGLGTSLTASNIVPPPPNVTRDPSSGSGRASADPRTRVSSGLGGNIVPPPPNVTRDPSSGSGRASADPRTGVSNGLGGNVVVPPPPSLSGTADSLSGRGTGNKGRGIGGPLDAGTALAPPTSGANKGEGKGVVVSSQPGSAVGVPGNASAGVLAVSPTGGNKPGAGGSGGGTGIGRGSGTGSGLSGEGPGAAKEGTGRGSDPGARNGISPYPGPGGAGNGISGQPPVAGVSVQGGGTVNLPSFGPNENDPASPGRSSPGAGGHNGFDVTIEGTSRSGGAFNFYGLIKGDKVYTKYLPTADGTVVMEFADPASAAHLYSESLTAPQPMRVELPAGIVHSPVAIACVLDRSGTLHGFQIIKASPGIRTSRILAALATWKFTPALRGSDPVEVTVYLGFHIDTQ